MQAISHLSFLDLPERFPLWPLWISPVGTVLKRVYLNYQFMETRWMERGGGGGGGSWCTKPGDQGTVTGANCQSLRGGQPVLLHTRSLLKANQARNIFPTARLAFSMSQTEVCDLEKTSLGVGKMTKNWHGKFRYKDYICVNDKHDKVGGGGTPGYW